MLNTVVIAPDSFKGSLSAWHVAVALGAGVRRARPDMRVVLAPLADGGEGMLECVGEALPGTMNTVRVIGVHNRPVSASWRLLADGRAVIESATVLGLPFVEAGAPGVARRGSFALGKLVAAVLDHQPVELVVGLGGSACSDAGLGFLMALGCKGYDRAGGPVTADFNGLLQLHELDWSGLDTRLRATPITALCDVDTPLRDAARVFGAQKGLSATQIPAFATAAAHLSTLCAQRADADISGSGAAGGLGFAMACVGARLTPGAQALIRMTHLPEKLAEADLVITGEGRADGQTLAGKLPMAVAQVASPTPTLLVCGQLAAEARPALRRHFRACYDLAQLAGSVQAALADPEYWLAECGARIASNLAG